MPSNVLPLSAHSGIKRFGVSEIHVANAITILDSDVSSFKSGHENTLVFDHRSLIKHIKQTAVINIIKCMFLKCLSRLFVLYF